MKNDDFLSMFQNISNNKPEKPFIEYFGILLRRKWILIVSLLFFISAAIAINTFAPKEYISSVLLKKENSEEYNRYDQFQQIVETQNTDKIETEMKLVTTSEVLGKVVQDLNLNLIVNEIYVPGNPTEEINDLYLTYKDNYLTGNPNGTNYPEFVDFNAIAKQSKEYYLLKTKEERWALVDADRNVILRQSTTGPSADFKLKATDIVFNWTNVPVGSKISFTILSDRAALSGLHGKISTEQDEETNLFRISVSSSNPQTAQLIASAVAEKFKETRIDQQKESIRYSHGFVDEQLDEVKDKLKNVETRLRNFKSANHLVAINDNSSQLVELLSTLEVEKVNVDLQLNEYRSKLSGMEKEYSEKGYFDQTYLTPERSSEAYTPFSSMLLKLADLEVARIEALNRKRENHPEIIKLDEQITEIKNKLASYNQNTITAYRIIINTLNEKQRNLTGLIQKYNSQLARLPGKETQYAELLREKDMYEKVFTLLNSKKEELRMAELSRLQDITIVEPAQRPNVAAFPNKKFNLLGGLFLGTVFGLGFITVVELVNRKKLSLEDLENEYSLPIFSIIPHYTKSIKSRIYNSTKLEDRFVVLMNSSNGYKETYRVLRTKLINCCPKAKTIMFTSCEEHSGKSTVVANLALVLVQSNKKVLMIDCDLKRAKLSNMFNISKKTPGLVNAIKESKNPKIYSLLKNNNGIDKVELHLIPPGGIKDNSSELLETESFKEIMEKLNGYQYDYILIDTPPVTRVVDPLILAQQINDTILVVRSDYTLKDSFKWGVQELKLTGTNIHGIVVNACDIENSIFKHRYGYGYDYSYDYSDEFPENNNGKKEKSAAPVI